MLPMLPDMYTVRARIAPALIAGVPAFALAVLVVPWSKFGISQFFSALSMTVLLLALSDIARRQGRRIEPKIYARSNGKPTVAMLRHRDSTLDATTKAKIVAFLANKLQEPVPSPDDEKSEPERVDAFFERAGAWLRESSRDTKRFNILFNENVTYGYRRNLFGLKPIALSMNLLVLIGCGVILCIRWKFGLVDEFNTKICSVFVIGCLHSAYLFLGVTENGVIEASQVYARQLLLSCIALDSGSASGKRSAKKVPTKAVSQD